MGYHEVVHAVKQRGNQPYQAFLDQVGGMLDNQSEVADQLLGVVMQSRFKEKQILELNFDELITVYDELNAVIWGYHKADPENARAQFAEVFQDYDAYIRELDAILEQARNGAVGPRMLPTAEQSKKLGMARSPMKGNGRPMEGKRKPPPQGRRGSA